MKKYIVSIMPFLVMILLVACNGDEKTMILANPTAAVLATPSESTTAYNKDSAAYVLNLDSTGTFDTFTATATNYGVNTPVTYILQMDKSGNNFANEQDVQSITTNGNPSIAVTVTTIYNIVTGSALNATTGVKASYDFRLLSTIGASKEPIYSNTITLVINPLSSLKPYTAVTPNLWYIIGLGDGKWTYSTAGIGVSMFPLSLVSGNKYNKAGDGSFTYTGYFSSSSGFKIVSGKASNMGTWSVQWGNNSSAGISSPVYCNGSSSNFQVPTSGYYTITLNSIANTLSIVAASAPSTTYSSMALSGAWNSWSSTANPMSAFNSTNNHQWYTTANLTSSQVKFNYNSWATSWGGSTFPYGIGTSNNGANIANTTGNFIICFNDIDECYYFIAD